MVIGRPEGLCHCYHWGIEPATFRLVAQCLKQLHNRVPLTLNVAAVRVPVPTVKFELITAEEITSCYSIRCVIIEN